MKGKKRLRFLHIRRYLLQPNRETWRDFKKKTLEIWRLEKTKETL